MNIAAKLVTILGLLTVSFTANAGDFVVPHQPGDKIEVHVRPSRYAHPTDYWWQKDPSSQGAWDYFTPVDHLYQPVRIEAPMAKSQEENPTIPVTHRPTR
ncbi:MAG: hypothetical protein HQL93_06165 [Magnetococcales bacterium]|nr:hypothetical protein [Magnetococcales bacterium]